MDDAQQGHPDEGTIHAWLDGALDDGAARALAAHVAACPACAERVAEARGLIAGASRIVGALDDVPPASGPAWGQAPASAPVVPARAARLLRVTPGRAAIAATLLIALGVSLTYKRAAVDLPTTGVVTERAGAPSTGAPAGAPLSQAATAVAPRRDPLLDSAIARNVAKALPPRAVEPAPGPAIPVAPPTAVASAPDAAAPARVAAGRAAMRAEREVGTSAAADQLAGRVNAPTRPADEKAVAAAARADTAPFAAQRASAGAAAKSIIQSPPRPDPTECYRVETANGTAATWGADALPLILRVDSAGHATAFTVAGQPTGTRATATRAADDSLLLSLRRLGYEGTLALGAPGDARAGVMRSRPLQVQLGEVVTTAAPQDAPSTARRRATAQKRAQPPAPATPSAEERAAMTAAPAIPVVARRVGCPS